jgi:hypothetical protein
MIQLPSIVAAPHRTGSAASTEVVPKQSARLARY